MHVVGTMALFLALGLALYGGVAAIVASRSHRPLLLDSARTTAYAVLALVVAANLVMLAALLRDDFSFRYVAENSSRATPTFFKVLALWSAHEGSLLLWILILAGYLAAVAWRFRASRPETLPAALAALYGIAAFYLFLAIAPASAFQPLPSAVLDGRGPLPLLQNNWLMAVHPPFLYLGFVGFSVPFAFALGALAVGNLSDWWLQLTRRWALAAWTFLTVGLTLGMLWSYGVLGWGGYWAWDPVENIALLPWLTGTAFLHSSILQERRGTSKTLTLSLAVGTFALTTFGTFVTRGGVLASVHAFARSPVGALYLVFLIAVLVVGFGLIALRAPALRSRASLESAISREAVLLGNNWALAAAAITVLLGTLLPLLIELVTDRQVGVGAPYFIRTTAPPFAFLLLLLGTWPVLSWRRSSPDAVRVRVAAPLLASAAAAAALLAAGAGDLLAVVGLALAAFAATANLGELARLVASTRKDAVRGERRLAGALVAHLAVCVVAAAIVASSAFARQTEVTLARGESTSFAGYEVRYERFLPRPEPQRMVLAAELSASRDGEVETLAPALNIYPAAAEPIGSPAIRFGIASDLYASVLALEKRGEQATFRLRIVPGVSWLWLGGLLLALGGVVALWPTALVRSGARRRMVRGAVAGERA